MKANRSATYPSLARTDKQPAPARRFRSTNLSQPSMRNLLTSRNKVKSRPTRTLAESAIVTGLAPGNWPSFEVLATPPASDLSRVTIVIKPRAYLDRQLKEL